jgi:hypothetical protein
VKKKRTKKYNPNKSQAIVSQQVNKVVEKTAVKFVDNVAMLYTLQNKVDLISLKTKKAVPFTQDYVDIFTNIPMNWSVYLIVFCVNRLGEVYHPMYEVTVDSPIAIDELNTVIKSKHNVLIRNAKEEDMVNIGWLAIPSGKQLSENAVMDLFKYTDPFMSHERGSLKLAIGNRNERDKS